jgi:hypothetical protein
MCGGGWTPGIIDPPGNRSQRRSVRGAATLAAPPLSERGSVFCCARGLPGENRTTQDA